MPIPITAEDAERHFLFVEKNMYRIACFIVPLVAFLALPTGTFRDYRLLTLESVAFVFGLLALNTSVCLYYYFRPHSLRAFIVFLLVPMPSITGTLAGLTLLDMVFADSTRVPAYVAGQHIITTVFALVLLFVIGFIWAVYGSRRSVRQAELLAAFRQRVLTTAQASMLMFFPQGKRPWGQSHYATMGGVFVSVLLMMRFNNVTIWYELVPLVSFVILTCGTALYLGMILGFYIAIRPLFRMYGDITIQR